MKWQRRWLAHYYTSKWQWQKAIYLFINHELKHIKYFYGQRDIEHLLEGHSPQQRWIEQSNHLEEALLLQALLGGAAVMNTVERDSLLHPKSGGHFTLQQRK